MTHERPARLVPTAVAAFKAARNISWGVKAVFIEDWILDRGPEASWISAANLAARLGMSKDNVERHRRWLLSQGFYQVVRREGARSDGWVPKLPIGHHGTTPVDVQATAARLDAIVHGTLTPLKRGGADAATRGVAGAASGGVLDAATRGVAGAATPARGASLIQTPSVGQALTDVEVAVREGAHAPEQEEQEAPRPLDARPADDVTDDGFDAIHRKRQAFKDAARKASA